MKYLVDTNVLSEPTKLKPVADVVDWLVRNQAQLTVNPIILGELEFGILTLPTGRQRTRLTKWFSEGAPKLQVVDLDGQTAVVWARLLLELRRKGKTMPVKDSLIAASARQHELTVVTRNVSDYRHAGVKLLNPFKLNGHSAR